VTMDEPGDADALCAALDALPEGEARVPLLVKLLGRGGHERHEDIVFELGLLGSPAAVPAIAKAVVDPFPYIDEWGNLHEFQRKCVLEDLAKHSDPCLREYGDDGLDHWPLPFKAR
jgi:hypothetical protein